MAYHSCKNCNHPFGTSHKFCPNCGLKQSEKLTIKYLFNNTIQNYLAFDARFFKSFMPLLFKPGYLPKAFVNGKRLAYLHPAQLYLFSTIFFFFLFSFQVNENANDLDTSFKDVFTDTEMSEEEIKHKKAEDSIQRVKIREALKTNKGLVNLTEKEIDSITTENNGNINFSTDFNQVKVDSLIAANAPDPLILKEMGLKEGDGFIKRHWHEQILKFYKTRKAGSIYKYFIQSIPIALFFILPIFALLLRLFYFKLKSYAQHLVFSFYYFAFLFFAFSFLLLWSYISETPDIVDFLVILSCFVYLVVAIKNFYNKKWVNTFFKATALVFTFFLFVIPIGVLVTLLFSFYFY